MMKNKKYQKFFFRGLKKRINLFVSMKDKKYQIFFKNNIIVIDKKELKKLCVYEVGSSSVLTRWLVLYDQN